MEKLYNIVYKKSFYLLFTLFYTVANHIMHISSIPASSDAENRHLPHEDQG